MCPITEQQRTLIQARIAIWEQKKKEARSDMSKMYAAGYLKCLAEMCELFETHPLQKGESR